MYKLANPPLGSTESNGVFRIADNAHIPFDPANTDYVAYLAWLAEGNAPEPADQPTE
jgi:hypothetical protein